MRIGKLIGFVLAFTAVFTGCKEKDKTSENTSEIIIGEYASMSGGTADFGRDSSSGLQLAIKQANDAGGVLGKKIKLITIDDESKPELAQNAVKRLISRENAIVIIGEIASTRSMVGAGICQQSKIPMVSPASTNPGVTKTGDYIFRVCFTDDFQGPVLARFAKDKGWKRIAILTDASQDYSKGLAKAFKETYAGSGEIVAEDTYPGNARAFQAQLSKIKATNPDAVFVPGYYGEVGLILTQARELQINIPFFGGDGWDSPETLALGKIADGCYYADHYHHDDPRPEAQTFLKEYRAAYGKPPGAMAVLGYDAGRVVIDSIKRAGKAEPAAIRDAIAQTKDFMGASGKITIDPDRNARKPIVVLELRGGATHLAKSIEP